MARTSRGFRKGTRKKLANKSRFKFNPRSYLAEFKPNTRVVIRQNPQSHKGMPHPLFKGQTGTVISKRGGAYVVEVFSGNKRKVIISRPEHLVSPQR